MDATASVLAKTDASQFEGVLSPWNYVHSWILQIQVYIHRLLYWYVLIIFLFSLFLTGRTLCVLVTCFNSRKVYTCHITSLYVIILFNLIINCSYWLFFTMYMNYMDLFCRERICPCWSQMGHFRSHYCFTGNPDSVYHRSTGCLVNLRYVEKQDLSPLHTDRPLCLWTLWR